MSKKSLYELWHSILEVAKYSYDELTGETTKNAIINEIEKYRTLNMSPKTEPKIVLDALRTHNILQSYAISQEQHEEIIRNYLQKGL